MDQSFESVKLGSYNLLYFVPLNVLYFGVLRSFTCLMCKRNRSYTLMLLLPLVVCFFLTLPLCAAGFVYFLAWNLYVAVYMELNGTGNDGQIVELMIIKMEPRS
ncbi:Hypothetical predicted protein [Olea europaea subsp. europaea]|uniref:Uncharacterized protein n=1 Tax=Olea europaea subsp. europaea TaxID=158383 RepID=A0A8S0PVI8_OLEEU|nr:Hypothetical predicted protein [Olea europaea subsp. europaea]